MSNAPYDPTTPIGKTRLHAADTDVSWHADNATFSDAEITYFLSISSQDPVLAAAFALEALAADSARLTNVIKTQSLTVERSDLANSLAQRAATLRTLTGIGGSISAPDAVFTTDNTPGGITGTMDGW